MKCIIADDEYLVRFSILDMLEEIASEMSMNFSAIEQAGNGEELLELLEALQPDIVFVDIKMPKVNGLEAMERGKRISPNTCWIILTGYAEFDFAKRAITLGAIDYLLKPASPEELQSCIESVICQIKERKISNRIRLEHQMNGILSDSLSGDDINERGYLVGKVVLPNRVGDSVDEFQAYTSFVKRLRTFSDENSDSSVTIGVSSLDDGNPIIALEGTTEAILSRGVAEFDRFLSGFSEVLTYCSTEVVRSLSDCIVASNQLVEKENLDKLIRNYSEKDTGKIITNRLVNRALSILSESFTNEIGLAQVAESLSVTPNYLSYEFHQKLGKTFTQYITELRLERAKELLGLHMHTIKEIASLVGYSSSKHFSKVFKQNLGVTPSEYLNQL